MKRVELTEEDFPDGSYILGCILTDKTGKRKGRAFKLGKRTSNSRRELIALLHYSFRVEIGVRHV